MCRWIVISVHTQVITQVKGMHTLNRDRPRVSGALADDDSWIALAAPVLISSISVAKPHGREWQ